MCQGTCLKLVMQWSSCIAEAPLSLTAGVSSTWITWIFLNLVEALPEVGIFPPVLFSQNSPQWLTSIWIPFAECLISLSDHPPVTAAYAEQMNSILAKYSAVKSSRSLLMIDFTTLTEYLHLLKESAQLLSAHGSGVMFYLAAAVSDFYIPPEHMVSMHCCFLPWPFGSYWLTVRP